MSAQTFDNLMLLMQRRLLNTDRKGYPHAVVMEWSRVAARAYEMRDWLSAHMGSPRSGGYEAVDDSTRARAAVRFAVCFRTAEQASAFRLQWLEDAV